MASCPYRANSARARCGSGTAIEELPATSISAAQGSFRRPGDPGRSGSGSPPSTASIPPISGRATTLWLHGPGAERHPGARHAGPCRHPGAGQQLPAQGVPHALRVRVTGAAEGTHRDGREEGEVNGDARLLVKQAEPGDRLLDAPGLLVRTGTMRTCMRSASTRAPSRSGRSWRSCGIC